MTIKEARQQAGLTQAQMSLALGIPKRTIEDWETERIKPRAWAEKLVIKELENFNKPVFKIYNDSVKKYAEICKKFSADTAKWGSLYDFKYYTTCGDDDWEETCDNPNNGVYINWAFQLSAEEIEHQAAEQLYELLLEELNLAMSDGWDAEDFEIIYNKFNFR